jgi:hypothetical protein
MKNYLLMVSDDAMEVMKKLIPSLQFVEVSGVNVKEFPEQLLLVTPYAKPVEQAKEEVIVVDENVKQE